MPNATDDTLLSLDPSQSAWAGPDDFCGVWLLEARFQPMVEMLGSENFRRSSAPTAPGWFARSGKLAVIPIRGLLMKQQVYLSSSTSTMLARRMVRAAAADKSITGILLNIDSPGGTFAGTQALGDDIHAAGLQKPVFAYVEDLAAAGAYWIASQAQQIFTIDTGMVGGIGTYLAVEDRSKLAEALKIKVHVVKAGLFKGAGYPGTKITDEQLGKWQDQVNGMNEHFLKAVSRGRKMTLDRVRGLADGRMHLGAQAHRLGLIDGLKSFDETLAALRNRTGKPQA